MKLLNNIPDKGQLFTNILLIYSFNLMTSNW